MALFLSHSTSSTLILYYTLPQSHLGPQILQLKWFHIKVHCFLPLKNIEREICISTGLSKYPFFWKWSKTRRHGTMSKQKQHLEKISSYVNGSLKGEKTMRHHIQHVLTCSHINIPNSDKPNPSASCVWEDKIIPCLKCPTGYHLMRVQQPDLCCFGNQSSIVLVAVC